MEKEQVIALATRFLRGEATQDEQARLHAWFDSWVDDEEQVTVTEATSENDLRRKILAQLGERISGDEIPSVKPLATTASRKYAWVAAAAVILVLTASFYFYFSNQADGKQNTTQTVRVSQDLAPGGDKAVLTLADGTKIVLDSAANGSLAQQAGVNVIKKDDGQIVYDIGKKAATTAEVIYNTISTPRGGQYKLTLPDGTQVWLNAETTLRYPAIFNGEQRRVELTGEAYFEVAGAYADSKKIPFIVSSGKTDVKVLGTHFNINAYPDEELIKTTLVEGRVQVYPVNNPAAILSLLPGQQANWDDASTSMTMVDNADIEQVLAWKNGFFKFNSTKLKTIMKQVARWYDVEIVYEGNTQDETFSGDIPRAEYASQVFKLLELTKTVKLSIDDKKVIVKSVKK